MSLSNLNNMFHFHKPRTYKSAEGCCVCRSKTSSSRFIDSQKFENDIRQCFDLRQPIKGDICNACVLLTKRFKRLPVGRKKSWNHMVDNRVGNTNDNKSNVKYKNSCKNCKVNNYDNQDPNNKKQSNRKGGFENNSPLENDDNFGANWDANFVTETLTNTKKLKLGSSYPGLLVSKHRNNRSQSNCNRSQNLNRNADSINSNADLMDQDYKNKRIQSTVGNTVVQFQIQTRASTQHPTRTQTLTDVRRRGITKIKGSKRRKCLSPRKFRKTSAFDEFIQFFDESEWKKRKTCCGTIYECINHMGSFLLDTAQVKFCENHKNVQLAKAICDIASEKSDTPVVVKSCLDAISRRTLNNNNVDNRTSKSTPALKKHYLFNKKQTKNFAQSDASTASVFNTNCTTIDTNKTELYTKCSAVMENSKHSFSSQLNCTAQKTSLIASSTNVNEIPNNLEEIMSCRDMHALNKSPITASKTSQLTIVPPAPPACILSFQSSSLALHQSKPSVASPASSTKFSDNSSDSGFDEALLERKSVSPLQDDTEKKTLIDNSIVQNQVKTSYPLISQNNQYQQQEKQINCLSILPGTSIVTSTQSSIKLNGKKKTSEKFAQITISPITNYNLNPAQSKICAIYNNNNTIQHENGVTTILPASSLAASNQTAAMKYMQPSKVTITPALPSSINVKINRKLTMTTDTSIAANHISHINHSSHHLRNA